MLMQMYGRLLRLSKTDKPKTYYKVATKNTAPYYVDLMYGMLCLTDVEWYSKYNGKNMDEILIPKVLTNAKRKSKSYIAQPAKKSSKPKVSLADLGVPLDMNLFRSVYYNHNDKFGTVSFTTLGDCRREFYDITKWDFNSVVEVAKKCYGRNDLSLNGSGAYSWARKNNKLDDLDQYYLIKESKWTLQKAIKEAKKYKTIGEVQKKNNSLAHWVHNNALKDTVYEHMSYRKSWTEDKVFEIAKKYTKFTVFKKEEKHAFMAANRLNIIDKVTSHMQKRKKWSIEEIKELQKSFEYDIDFRRAHPQAYNAAFRFGLKLKMKK
jgi:hypothetical protein